MLYTVEQLVSLPAEMPVTSFSGTVTSLFPRKSGTSARGEWSIQNGTLKDNSGKEIKVVFKDRDEVPQSWRGKMVTITARQGDKGWTGVKTKDDTYEKNGQSITTRVLWVTPTAEIVMGVGPIQQTAPNVQVATAQPTQVTGQTFVSSPYVQPNVAVTPPKDPVFDIQQRLIQLGNLYLMCLDQAAFIAKEHERRHNTPIPQEQFQAVASSLWITATKERFQDSLPQTPIFAAESAEPTN